MKASDLTNEEYEDHIMYACLALISKIANNGKTDLKLIIDNEEKLNDIYDK